MKNILPVGTQETIFIRALRVFKVFGSLAWHTGYKVSGKEHAGYQIEILHSKSY
jgi:hypothetical protein